MGSFVADNLHHANCVATYAHEIKQMDTSQGREQAAWKLYLVQEFCNGGSLRELIHDGVFDTRSKVWRAQRWDRIARTLQAISEGMVYVHSRCADCVLSVSCVCF